MDLSTDADGAPRVTPQFAGVLGCDNTELVLPRWAFGVPGAFVMPIRDLGGLPAVYVLGRGRETLHVGQSTDVATRAMRYGEAWRELGLDVPTWALVWPVPLRALHRTEAALQTWLLPTRDTPKTIYLQAHHVEWLERLGMERREIRVRYRQAWASYWRREGRPAPPCRMPR